MRDRYVPDEDMPQFEDHGHVHALADAYASIDGRLYAFRKGIIRPIEAWGGYFAGYTAEADEMIRRLGTRGYIVVRKH